jgi:ATP-dependent Clp protease adaptor protein ClpS
MSFMVSWIPYLLAGLYRAPAKLDKPAWLGFIQCMAEIATPEILPDLEREKQTGSKSELEPGWQVICWNDPVNLMHYVTHVFQTVFGWNREKAEFHMLQVHNDGKSLLARTTMEQAEHYVHQLQKYTLHATMEREP